MKDILVEFRQFIKENLPLLIWSFLIGLLVYATFLTVPTIGIDSDCYLADTHYHLYEWHLKEGRFGLTLIQLLFGGSEGLNVLASYWGAFLLLVATCIFWCFILNKYSRKKSTVGLYFFSVFFISSVVWMEIMYFTFMAVQCMLGLALVPVSVLLSFEGIRKRKRTYEIIAIILLVISTSTYQLMVGMYFAGMLMVYIAWYDSANASKKDEKKHIVGTFAITIIAILVYALMNIFVSFLIFGQKMDDYVTTKVSGGSFGYLVNGVFRCLYAILVGKDNAVNNLFEAHFSEITSRIGSLIFLIAFLFYIINMFRKRKERSVLFVIVFLMMVGSMLAVPILSGGNFADRYMHAVPLVTSFLVFDMIGELKKYKKVIGVIVLSISAVFACRFCWSSSLLLNSNVERYEQDVLLCQNVGEDIIEAWNENGLTIDSVDNSDNPVLFLGTHKFSYRDHHIDNGIIGVSALNFGAECDKTESTIRMIPFMNAHGYALTALDKEDDRIDRLREYAASMPIYPNEGSVQVIEGVTIVKLSDLVVR